MPCRHLDVHDVASFDKQTFSPTKHAMSLGHRTATIVMTRHAVRNYSRLNYAPASLLRRINDACEGWPRRAADQQFAALLCVPSKPLGPGTVVSGVRPPSSHGDGRSSPATARVVATPPAREGTRRAHPDAVSGGSMRKAEGAFQRAVDLRASDPLREKLGRCSSPHTIDDLAASKCARVHCRRFPW